MNLHEAIFKLNPTVTQIRDSTAFDLAGNIVSYDLSAAEALVAANAYKAQRARKYPPINDYLDGVVKGDQAQIDAYIAACRAVKEKYPKG